MQRLHTDILYNIFKHIEDNDPLIKIRALIHWSQTSKTLYSFFAPDLKKAAIQCLIELILKPTTTTDKVIIALAASHPDLFFIKCDAAIADFAVDLDGNQRKIQGWSAYQAILGANDSKILSTVRKFLISYLETIQEGFDLAENQLKEKFPHGLIYQPSNYNFAPLAEAFANDPQIRKNLIPSETTLQELRKFREYFKPGTIKNGHHFNMNHLINVLIYYNRNEWNMPRNSAVAFSIYVIGYLQRLVPASFISALCNGLDSTYETLYVNGEIDGYKLHNPLPNIERNYIGPENISTIPFDGNPLYNLGKNLFIECRNGGARNNNHGGIALHDESGKTLEDICQQNISYLEKLSITHDNIALEKEKNNSQGNTWFQSLSSGCIIS